MLRDTKQGLELFDELESCTDEVMRLLQKKMAELRVQMREEYNYESIPVIVERPKVEVSEGNRLDC